MGGAASSTRGAVPAGSNWQDSPADFTPLARNIHLRTYARQFRVKWESITDFLTACGIPIIGRPPNFVNANIADPYMFAVNLPGSPPSTLSNRKSPDDSAFGEWVRANLPSIITQMDAAVAVSDRVVGPRDIPMESPPESLVTTPGHSNTPTRSPDHEVSVPERASPGTDVVGGRFRLDAFRNYVTGNAEQGTSDGSLTYDQLAEERGIARVVLSSARALGFAAGGFVGDDCIYTPAPEDSQDVRRYPVNPSRAVPSSRLAVAEALTDPDAAVRIRSRTATGRLLGPAVVGVVRDVPGSHTQHPVPGAAEQRPSPEENPQVVAQSGHPGQPSQPRPPRPLSGSGTPTQPTDPDGRTSGGSAVAGVRPGTDRPDAAAEDVAADISDDGEPAVPDFGEHTDNVGHRPPAGGPDSDPDAFGVIAIHDDTA